MSLETKTILLGSSSGTRVFTFDHFWADGTGTWKVVDSTQGRDWNIIKLPSGPFFHVLSGIQTQIVRIPAATLTQQTNIPTATVVQSVAHIGTESFALVNAPYGPWASVIRWVEDGVNTQHRPTTLSASIYRGSQTKFADAYSVGSCPYFIIYTAGGSVKFAKTITATAYEVNGDLNDDDDDDRRDFNHHDDDDDDDDGDGDITSLTFARGPSSNSGSPPSSSSPQSPTPDSSPSRSTVVPTLSPSSSPCSSRPPSPISSFSCVNGSWHSNQSVTVDSITVSSAVTVASNLTTKAIIYNGLSSSVTVSGCASVNGTLTLYLTQEEMESLRNTSVPLLTANGCANSVLKGKILLTVVGPKKSCEKFEYGLSEQQTGSQYQLVALMNLDMGGCKNSKSVALIIGICVPIGVVFLVVLGVVLAAIFSSSFRTKFRPYAKKNTY